VFSLLIHALIIALAVRSGERLWSRTLAPGDPALAAGGGGGGGGGGGPRVAYITLPPPTAPKMPRMTPVTSPPPPPTKTEPLAAPPPTPVVPAPTPPPAPSDTQPTPAVASAPTDGMAGTTPGAGPGAGGGTGGGEGPGIGSDRGPGAGPGNGGGGAGGSVRPPELRDLAFPFDTPPKELRGASLAVTFWVRVDGRVDRYEVAPEIADRDYARKFDEVIRAFRFTPARAPDGTTVAGTTTVTFTLPGKRNS
jgi:protein TonB